MIPDDFNWSRLQNGSDIRGVAMDGVEGESINLTPAVMATLAQAFAHWIAQQQDCPLNKLIIAVGRDSRLSGPELMDAVLKGIQALGVQVIDVGLASTPAMFMSTLPQTLKASGAMMLTASHLPFNRNGVKFFTESGGLEKANITSILDIAQQQTNIEQGALKSIQSIPFIETYAQGLVTLIRKRVNHPTQYERPLEGLKIIVDAGNGAGGFFASQVLEPLGADTEGSQFLDPDGTFPNHVPNPEDAAAIASIKAAVIAQKADFGVIFDTDVDRAGAVDAAGQELNRNRLIALIAAIILKEHPGSTIVTDSITSDGLTTFIESELQGKHHRYIRGYKNVINEAIRLNEQGEESWLAIETSGHAALKENYFLDDGAYLISKLLIELAKSHMAQEKLTDLISNLIEPQESQEFRLKIQASEFKEYGNDVIQQMTDYVRSQSQMEVVPNTYEGIRVQCLQDNEQGWFSMRLSLHDPVLPLNIESNVAGGISHIIQRLQPFFQQFKELDLSPLELK